MADEPTGNLDSRTGREVMALFRELNEEEDITLIVVTHDSVVARHSKRIVVLRDGSVVEDTPDLAQATQATQAAEEEDFAPNGGE